MALNRDLFDPIVSHTFQRIVTRSAVRNPRGTPTTLTGDTPTQLRLTWRTSPAARAALEAEIFGKRVLFTDHHDRPLADI
ncbi:MAG: hypothetical protein JJE52_12315, partial [Acidimicrobiia bacterium]|nr:hypothetical protein [Acidimicrobiia bacterium]